MHGNLLSPSDFAWWGWPLCALVFGLVSYFLLRAAESNDDHPVGCLLHIVALAGCIAALLAGIITIARLVHWVRHA